MRLIWAKHKNHVIKIWSSYLFRDDEFFLFLFLLLSSRNFCFVYFSVSLSFIFLHLSIPTMQFQTNLNTSTYKMKIHTQKKDENFLIFIAQITAIVIREKSLLKSKIPNAFYGQISIAVCANWEIPDELLNIPIN